MSLLSEKHVSNTVTHIRKQNEHIEGETSITRRQERAILYGPLKDEEPKDLL